MCEAHRALYVRYIRTHHYYHHYYVCIKIGAGHDLDTIRLQVVSMVKRLKDSRTYNYNLLNMPIVCLAYLETQPTILRV